MGQMTTTDKVSGWLSAPSEKVLAQLPEGYSIDEAKRLALYLRGNTELAKCSAESIYQCVLKSAALRLFPDLNEVYFVRYGQQAQMMISYTGLIKLAKRSGRIKHVWAAVAREGDHVRIIEGSDSESRRIEHEPIPFSDAPVIGAYAVFRLADGTEDFEVLTMGDLKAIRSKASNGSMMWNEFFCEAAKKAAIRRGIKRMELLPDDVRAIVDADAVEYDYSDRPKRHRPSLAQSLGVSHQVDDEPAQIEEDSEPTGDDGHDSYDEPIDV